MSGFDRCMKEYEKLVTCISELIDENQELRDYIKELHEVIDLLSEKDIRIKARSIQQHPMYKQIKGEE